MDFNTIKANFLEVFKNCFDFKTKWSRTKYWTFAITLGLAVFIVSTILGFIPYVGWLICMLLSVAQTVVGIGPACCRLRDAGFSPWHMLWCLTAIGCIVPLVMCLLPTKEN